MLLKKLKMLWRVSCPQGKMLRDQNLQSYPHTHTHSDLRIDKQLMNMRSDYKIKLSKKTNNILVDILLKASNFTTKKED